MRRFDLIGFRDRLHDRGLRAGFDITYPHGVELPGRTAAIMGSHVFNSFLDEARQWCRDNLAGQFTTKRMRVDALRETGIRFEFAVEADAACFKLWWC